MSVCNVDLIVIGAGPGGYVAAIRAAQLGMKVACVEKDKTLGGTCLNVGCIPSKALLESSELYAQAREKFASHGISVGSLKLDLKKFMERKDQVVKQLTGGVATLFKKNKVMHVTGMAKILRDKSIEVAGNGDLTKMMAKHVIIATGSRPVSIPGIEVDGKGIVDSTGALCLSRVPKELIVIGGGYIGLELGSVYARLGARVTVVEALDRIVPAMDHDTGRALHRVLEKQGMAFKVSTQVKKVEKKKDGTLDMTLRDAAGKETLQNVDTVLVAVGRKPYTGGLGLNEAGIKTDEKGRIVVDQKYQTSLPGVYAIGDVIAGPMLAHKASEEGVAVVEMLAGHAGHVNYGCIPAVVYTWPEVAAVGISEEEAKQNGIDYKTSKYSFMASGRALAMGEKDGFVKLIADKKTDRILGGHIIGARASDMIAELVVAMEFSASAEDIARTCHAHPTLSEAIKEAALGLGSGAIHS